MLLASVLGTALSLHALTTTGAPGLAGQRISWTGLGCAAVVYFAAAFGLLLLADYPRLVAATPVGGWIQQAGERFSPVRITRPFCSLTCRGKLFCSDLQQDCFAALSRGVPVLGCSCAWQGSWKAAAAEGGASYAALFVLSATQALAFFSAGLRLRTSGRPQPQAGGAETESLEKMLGMAEGRDDAGRKAGGAGGGRTHAMDAYLLGVALLTTALMMLSRRAGDFAALIG
eukprot:COSAG04_NODE_6397_length_1337_cov_1.201131_1_plen_230_part_00